MGNMKPLKNQICWSILGVFGLQHWSALIIIGLSIGKSSHPKSRFLSSFIPTGWWHAKMLIGECQAFLTRCVKQSNGVIMLFNPNFSKSYWSLQNPCLGTTNRSQKMHICWNASWCVLGWFIIIHDGSCSWNQKEISAISAISIGKTIFITLLIPKLLPLKEWKSHLDASNFDTQCLQKFSSLKQRQGQSSCLKDDMFHELKISLWLFCMWVVSSQRIWIRLLWNHVL